MQKVLDNMDSNLQSSPSKNDCAKAAFRKPSNDAANRKYRRRTPVGGSSSPDDGPSRERSSSPLREDTAKVFDDRRRRDDGRDLDRHNGRSQYSRSGDSYRHSDRQSSRSSHNYPRQDDHSRRDKHADEDERSKLSSRSGRVSRGGIQSDHRRESDHDRSKDHSRNVSKYSRDKSDGSGYRSRDKDRETSSLEYKKYKDMEDGGGRDEKRDYRRSSGARKSDRSPIYEEARGRRNDSAQRDSEGQKSPAKKPKLLSDGEIDHGKDVSKFTNKADERQQSSSSKQGQEFIGKVTSEQDFVKDSDIDAAKVAAIKAAELVNRNLIGTGYMSTDQKKKLLWGNKKATPTEEPAHRWDASLSLFPDQERQEKFKKLMGVKGEVKVESSGLLQAEKQKELQIDLEKQYTAGLRRRDGRTVGLGL